MRPEATRPSRPTNSRRKQRSVPAWQTLDDKLGTSACSRSRCRQMPKTCSILQMPALATSYLPFRFLLCQTPQCSFVACRLPPLSSASAARSVPVLPRRSNHASRHDAFLPVSPRDDAFAFRSSRDLIPARCLSIPSNTSACAPALCASAPPSCETPGRTNAEI
eukprot:3086220-Pleurochrysis_carterae.AAC.1